MQRQYASGGKVVVARGEVNALGAFKEDDLSGCALDHRADPRQGKVEFLAEPGPVELVGRTRYLRA